ncbi:hypothetical protein B0I37DRAFT_370129 [Chaetomium sp. MPI-CAGE-AT-0009]|nr:hypothetical protein B0I37DRAFT_370129 [Chaetomium sp. MPI-CAGE-AT-0009]
MEPKTARLQKHPVLIDLGTVVPEYEGDAEVSGTLLLWCVENVKGLREDAGAKARVVLLLRR